MSETRPAESPSPRARRDSPAWVLMLLSVVCSVLVLTTRTGSTIWLWPIMGVCAVLSIRMKTSRTRTGARLWQLALGLVLLVPVGIVGVRTLRQHFWTSRDNALVLDLVTTEELILQLTPKLQELSGGLLNLKLPDPRSRGQFDETVWSVDLGSDPPASRQELRGVAVSLRGLPVAHERVTSPAAELDLWRPLLDRVAYFEHARFYFVDGALTEGFGHFQGNVGFAGLARMRSGEWQAVKARQTVHWRRLPAEASDSSDDASGDPAAPRWRIDGWETRELKTASSRQLLFVESLDQALPDAGDLGRARHSLHHQAAIRYYKNGATILPARYFAAISANQKPGLSVVDIDGDGFDDLYVMVRMGKNQLLRNRGDGTFEEVAAEFGLDLPGNSTCGVFADFDNDGDPDLMLGRSIDRSLYLENREGRFSERPQESALPFLAISMAAADYNGDGLLDVYLSTYRPAVLAGAGKSGGDAAATGKWPEEFLEPEQAKEYFRKHSAANDGTELFSNFLDQVGPPNVLLVNRGRGRFEVAPESPQLELWRNTLQATWADYDDDGDPDVYVANDWARDHLFRNDGEDGFVDVTATAGTDAFGFAMGVSWGDYDNDGRQDLYVSNMYSKAGRRITASIEDLDPDYAESAGGNYLYRQSGAGRFDRVSGHEPPALTVAKAGWSWGGQFADFDNDTYVDLYVLSGYFTAPKSVASNLDL